MTMATSRTTGHHTDKYPENGILKMGNFLQNSYFFSQNGQFFLKSAIIRQFENNIAHSNPNFKEILRIFFSGFLSVQLQRAKDKTSAHANQQSLSHYQHNHDMQL